MNHQAAMRCLSKGSEPVTVVDLVVSVDSNGVPSTSDQCVSVRGEGFLFTWTLDRSASDWAFLGNGISIEEDHDGQFINPYRFKRGNKVALFDRNTSTSRKAFKYTVALVNRKDGKTVIVEDPIIENEGDG